MDFLTDSQPLTEEQLSRINPRIRLTPREQLAMIDVFAGELPPASSAYLFGSRTDLNAAGGDIDLLIHVPGIRFDDEISLSTRLSDSLMVRLGERKMDLLITAETGEAAKPFVKLALAGAVKLYP